MSEAVTITERAARRIGEILRGEPAGSMLRVSVEGGGCSGFQYRFGFEQAKAADDLVLALHKQQKRGATEAGVKHEDGPEPPVKLPRLRRRTTWLAAHRLENAVYYRRLDREEMRNFAGLDAAPELFLRGEQ